MKDNKIWEILRIFEHKKKSTEHSNVNLSKQICNN